MKHALLAFIAATGIGAGLSACGDGENEVPEETWSYGQEVDVCKGDNTLPSGGKFASENAWKDVGAADVAGYTGIDSNKAADKGLIEAEKKAAAKLNGKGCIYGAHGADPDKCGGKTTVQSLPSTDAKSVFNKTQKPECDGKPIFMSVCFGGKKGTPPYIAIAAAAAENSGVPPEKIVACTGLVGPGDPMKCYGSLVDGNGKEIGDQQVGDLKFIQVRGDPPEGELIRCGKDEPCKVCTPDGGVDAGSPYDAGSPPPYDAGSPPPYDAGTDAGYDAGSPPPYDAGSPPPYDAGSPPPYDAGSPPPYDAGW